MTSVVKGNFECKVSSVLNKDIKQFGKKYLFDGNDETCWNSDQGSPQYVSITLPKEEAVASIAIQFQGGFVGQDCRLKSVREDGTENKDEPFYPEDINAVQTFRLSTPIIAKKFTILFSKSTDFFGRIVIYKLDILSTT